MDIQKSTNNKAIAETTNANEEKKKILSIFKDESAKCEMWSKKYIANSMFVLGSGAFGSVFQVTTRQYKSKQKMAKNRYSYHPGFLEAIANQRRVKPDQIEKLRDRNRDDDILDIVAIKYEIVDQAQLEDGTTRFFLFLRREFLVLDAMWHKNYRLMHGFPVVFDYGYVGDKMHYGINQKYKNIFTYLSIQGEEVKFFTDINNRNLEGVTKISYMTMELLGPSIDDFRNYYEPWFAESNLKTFFNVATVFKLADQVLCRLYILHKCGFVHHDLKPDNIAMGNGKAMNTVYLLDFGFAKQLSSAKPNEWMGSRKFIAVDTYNGGKPNFAQDIESWFYVIMTLLYDALPWSEEYINQILDENADENARWLIVTNMKKTWWGDSAEAASLKEMIKCIAELHSHEVPDIKTILEQIHKRVRELRNTMRTIDDAQTLHCEISNTQSNLYKGYMSVRKAMLQIFNLPSIHQNPALGDAELKALQETRIEKNYPVFDWHSRNFQWEWDENHARFTNRPAEATEPTNQHSCWIENQHSAGQVRPCTLPLGISMHLHPNGLLGNLSVKKDVRNDEVSYVYDPERKILLPKENGRQRLFLGSEEDLREYRKSIFSGF